MNPEELSKRIKAGLSAARKSGVHVGRPKGRMTAKQLVKHHKKVVLKLKEGAGVSVAALATGKSESTVRRVWKALQATKRI